mgnify:CR=1 FL=1
MATRKSRKGGYVYFGRSERKNGSVQEYVGSTTRTVAIREKEHKREVRKSNSKTWVGKGTTFKVTDSFYSSNPRKAEATIKRKRKSKYKSGNYRSKYSGQKAKNSSTRSSSSSNSCRPKRSSRRRQRSRKW